MRFTIRKLSLNQAGEISRIVTDSLKVDFPYKKETISAYSKMFNKKYFADIIKGKKNVAFGAYIKNELIGIVIAKAEYGGVVYVEWIVIKKNFRGEGIGSKLLEEVEKWCILNKNHYIYLNTETDKNIEYYKKRGFRYVGVHKNFWFGEDEHILGKNLV